jgi:hypothetical protein
MLIMASEKKQTTFHETDLLKIQSISFGDTKGKSSGGKTGSESLKDKTGITHQVKPSILSAATTRRIKARNLDQENFGELIAASVGRAVTGADDHFELVPKVFLVYDEEKKQCKVASRWLSNAKTLDEYGATQGAHLSGGHIKISAHEHSKAGVLNISDNSEQNKIFRRDLATGIAVSILSSDHDVNPGNMMALEHGRIARIDFGHAFNDLLRAPKSLGGQIRNKHNSVLDFLNRNTLSNLNPNNQDTKLWKSYDGVVPSKELAEAFKTIGSSKNLKEGLNDARTAFADLVHQLERSPKENQRVAAHIKRSLNSINNNIGGEKIDTKSPKFFEKFFHNLEKYYDKNQKQMVEVSKLMELQLKVDSMLVGTKNKQHGQEHTSKMWKELQEEYKAVSKIESLKAGKDKIEWIKSDKDKPPFKGNLEGYIKHKAKELNINIHFGKPPESKFPPHIESGVAKIFDKLGNSLRGMISSDKKTAGNKNSQHKPWVAASPNKTSRHTKHHRG